MAALEMLRRHFTRVAVVALILFLPPPTLEHLLEGLRMSMEADTRLIGAVGFVLGLLLATLFRLFGPVVYAGYLDEAVGREYYRGHTTRLREVLRELPWVRLLLADVIVVIGTAVGLALFVVPGIAFVTLFGLVGPVIVQEHHGIAEGLRRTYRISRPAWRMIVTIVVIPLAIEHAVAELLYQGLVGGALLPKLVVEWTLAVTLGAMVGLIEVALASELMARHPIKQ